MRKMASMLLWGLIIASEAFGGMHQTALAELDGIPNNWRELGLQAWINDGVSRAFTIGSEVTFHFWAGSDSYLSMVHVDSHGAVSLIAPRVGSSDSLLAGERDQSFPSPGAEITFVIVPPLGRERVYVVATKKPVHLEKLEKAVGLAKGQAASEAAAVPLAKLFKEQVISSGDASAVVTLDYRVLGRSRAVQYTPKDIVDYFTQRSKAISRPSLDVHIKFAFDSTNLDDKAKGALDVWGKALQEPALKNTVFVIGGHTDDVGTEAYNLDLARRRAAKVEAYLTQQFRLDPKRFSIKAHGESRPLEPGQSPEVRAANRRVEFELAN